MCPCETYTVSALVGDSRIFGEYERIWRGEYFMYRPFDVFQNTESGTFLFFWPKDLDWHIGTELCPCVRTTLCSPTRCSCIRSP